MREVLLVKSRKEDVKWMVAVMLDENDKTPMWKFLQMVLFNRFTGVNTTIDVKGSTKFLHWQLRFYTSDTSC